MRRRLSRHPVLAAAIAVALAGSVAALVWVLPHAHGVSDPTTPSTASTPAASTPAASTPAGSTPTGSTATAARSALSVPGRGATVPFTEYEAEAATTNGTVLAASRTAGTLASEASGRSAVTLSGRGRYVELTVGVAANAVDVRYSVPDSRAGSAYTTPLAVYVNGAKDQDLTLTNRYSWFYGGYPGSNTPGSAPRHFYDDVRTMFRAVLAPGTRVRLQVDSGSVPVTVDTADFERVSALDRPAGSLSVTDYGADPMGNANATSAFLVAIAAATAQHRTLWVPAGTYTVTGHLLVDNVTITGAGLWYSVLHGNGVGIYGRNSPGSTNVHVSDLAVFGEVVDRDDNAAVNAFGGALGKASTISDVWMQHVKVGVWLDGPLRGLTISGCRIQDTTADGVNLHDGVTDTTVTNNVIRNTGDDGLAMWSQTHADSGNVFSFNTVELPILANNIALYGGHDNSVIGNVVADTQTEGGGLHVGQRFGSTPLSGVTTLARNTTLRAGVMDPNWHFGIGAVWFDARDAAMSGRVNVTDTAILDSSYEAIQFVSGPSITNVHFTNVTIDGTGTFAVQVQVGGSATFTNVTATRVGARSGVFSCMPPGHFTIVQGAGNSGWYADRPYCGSWPQGRLGN
jgi:hypothetical protein